MCSCCAAVVQLLSQHNFSAVVQLLSQHNFFAENRRFSANKFQRRSKLPPTNTKNTLLGQMDSETNSNHTHLTDISCAICLHRHEDLSVILPCRHRYGVECLMKWIQARNDRATCPECRGPTATRRELMDCLLWGVFESGNVNGMVFEWGSGGLPGPRM